MRRILGAIVVVAVSLSVPGTAWPCLNGVLSGNEAVRRVKYAEQLLRTGKYEAAMQHVGGRRFTDERVQARAELVRQTSSMRILLREKLTDRSERVVTYFRAQVAAKPDDPILQARLAEVLLIDPADAEAAGEARTLIEDLVTRDLVPDAAGWVVAATVRDRASDATGRDAALARCKKVAARARNLPCRVIAQ